nr:MAG TPA: hypothetical protein [Caudoviricetes sp.]
MKNKRLKTLTLFNTEIFCSIVFNTEKICIFALSR